MRLQTTVDGRLLPLRDSQTFAVKETLKEGRSQNAAFHNIGEPNDRETFKEFFYKKLEIGFFVKRMHCALVEVIKE